METVNVTVESDGLRIDSYLASLYEDKSRSFFQKLLKEGSVRLNGSFCKASAEVFLDDVIEIDFPELRMPEILPEKTDMDIVYEDSDLLIVNKPKGMVVHPSPGHFSGTLVNSLLGYCSDLSGINGVLRPGIVHRIDKDTSGLLVVCKNDFIHRKMAELFSVHDIKRNYLAIVRGNLPDDHGTIDAPIGRSKTDRKKMAVVPDGKNAVTCYDVLSRNGSETYISCRLQTGRTHQIRVHMRHIGFPLYGDPVYGTKKDENASGQYLHAASLGFVHPRSGKEIYVEKEPPEDFQKVLKKLNFNL